jgi:phosphotransferase system  glucose/maltose/N-acetylglucosamine-specific IIC component
MTNFQNHLIRALPFGFISAILLLIQKPKIPTTEWYAYFILGPIAVIILSSLSVWMLEKRDYERKRRALHEKLQKKQNAEDATPTPPDNWDGPEAA